MKGPLGLLARTSWLGRILLGLIGYSLAVIGVAWWDGWAFGREITLSTSSTIKYLGYLNKPNWFLYPLFWLLIGACLHGTWTPFLRAWGEFRSSGVLHTAEGGEVSRADYEFLVRRLDALRVPLLVIAIATSFGLTWLGTSDLRAWDKLFERVHEETLARVVAAPKTVLKDPPEYDFTITYIVEAHECLTCPVDEDRQDANQRFRLIAYAQQVIIGGLAILILLQVIVQCLAFWFLERLRFLNPGGRLAITMDPRSPLKEFGLEYWNHALNNIYWLFAFGMIVPMISRAAQADPKSYDLGQVVLQVAVPALIGAPMILTMFARQQRLADLWPKLQKLESIEDPLAGAYHEQLLWPLDRNWVSKLGIIVTFFLLSYFLGTSLAGLL